MSNWWALVDEQVAEGVSTLQTPPPRWLTNTGCPGREVYNLVNR